MNDSQTHQQHAQQMWEQAAEAVSPTAGGEGSDSVNTTSCTFTVGNITVDAKRALDGGRIIISATTAPGKAIYRNKMDPDSAISRRRVAADIAQKAGTDNIDEIDQALLNLHIPARPDQRSESEDDPAAARARRDEVTQRELEKMPNDIVSEAERMLEDPRLIDLIVGDIGSLGVVGEEPVALTLYLQGCSRLLKHPLSSRVYGTSSSGKSYVIETVSGLFPHEDVLRATDLTPNALYYLDLGTLMHTFVVAGERSKIETDEKAECKRALREMISAGELRKILPLKQPDGSFRTESIYQPGPIAFVESTTTTRIFDEDENRCVQLSTDESSQQTARILAATAERAMRDRPDTTELYLRHVALQRLLKRVEVRVPFAGAIARRMPSSRPEARRALPLMLGVISASAALHQRQRANGSVEHGTTIEATLQDYVVARRLMFAPLGRALGGALPEAVENFGRRLRENFGTNSFTSTSAMKQDKIISSKGKVNEYLVTLAAAGVIECIGESRGSKPGIWRVTAEVPEPGAAWLPTVDQIEQEQRQ